MASGPVMLVPICLVENKNDQISVNQKALKILHKISQPVVVVAIVGLYRTGKCYLMNCLAREKFGFPLGSTVQSETKGIWMWCVPHPSRPNHTLVLLDTEGLGDVEKGDPKNDSWIFALAVLLSSTLVYNSMSTINNDALEKIHYVTELTELIRAKSSPTRGREEDSTEFVSFFPDFIWTVRDFTLELKLNGLPITEDEYLENALKMIPGLNPKVKNSNISRECIKHFFPRRKCFVFDRPMKETELLAHIDNILESELDPKFRKQSDNFCNYIFTHSKTKTLREGIKVTGNRFGTLVMTYVDTINKGAVPCLENAVTTLAQLENSTAMQKAADHYGEQMAKRVSFPTETLQELLDLYAACEREAIAVFMENSFKDEDQVFQKKLMEMIKDKKETFLQKNEDASIQYCQYTIDQISMILMESVSEGTYFVHGGHRNYVKERRKIERRYWEVPRKGVKAREVFQRFLESQRPIEKSILLADKALTQMEKDIAEEQARKEAAEKEQELLRQRYQEQQQQLEAQNRSLQENVAQLKGKLEREREEVLQEYIRTLELKLQTQGDLHNSGFKEKSKEMEAEIRRLRKQIEDKEKDDAPWIAKALDRFADEVTAVLSLAGKIVGKGLKVLSSLFK